MVAEQQQRMLSAILPTIDTGDQPSSLRTWGCLPEPAALRLGYGPLIRRLSFMMDGYA